MTKIAIITGGSGKLGQHIVNYLLKKKFFVYSLDLNYSKKKYSNFKSVKIDITDEGQVSQFFNQIKNINLLVNNAGIGVYTPTLKRTLEDFKKVLDVNLVGNFLMSKNALKLMKKQKNGKIINLGSIYGIKSSDPRIYGKSGRNNSEVYSASKAGVIMLTKYLAAHFAKYNIQINCISPGGFLNNQTKDFVNNYNFKNPSNRMAEVKDLNSVLNFLIDKDNTYTNGTNIILDGGFTLW
jgi:NAD(P)-dependent dehydrogenase (short-subunit alcohol dehydrogenase family)